MKFYAKRYKWIISKENELMKNTTNPSSMMNFTAFCDSTVWDIVCTTPSFGCGGLFFLAIFKQAR